MEMAHAHKKQLLFFIEIEACELLHKQNFFRLFSGTILSHWWHSIMEKLLHVLVCPTGTLENSELLFALYFNGISLSQCFREWS
jgi:hypothetical protein